jgi:nucleotide-binding universal stress UspA family protein
MKTFFVATDFSNAAHNALVYAANLAKHIGARIILFHAYQRVLTSADMVVMETTDELREKCEELVHDEVAEIKKLMDVDIEGRIALGSINSTILKAAENLQSDYIIVGMKGTGKTVRKIFGSTAIAMCRQSHIPVIAVPEFANFTKPETVALASDISDETNMHILDPLLAFGQTFRSNIFVVRVTSNVKNEMFVRLEKTTRIKWHLQEMNPNFEYLNDDDVVHALHEFVSHNQVNMLVLIGREHNFLEKLFLKSVIKEMLFETHVPLMVLPDKTNAVTTPEPAAGYNPYPSAL